MSYIVTRKVRHITVWTAHERSEAGYVTGRHRPICGAYIEVRWDAKGHYPRYQWNESPMFEDVTEDMKKPLCKRCVKALADLNRAGAQ